MPTSATARHIDRSTGRSTARKRGFPDQPLFLNHRHTLSPKTAGWWHARCRLSHGTGETGCFVSFLPTLPLDPDVELRCHGTIQPELATSTTPVEEWALPTGKSEGRSEQARRQHARRRQRNNDALARKFTFVVTR